MLENIMEEKMMKKMMLRSRTLLFLHISYSRSAIHLEMRCLKGSISYHPLQSLLVDEGAIDIHEDILLKKLLKQSLQLPARCRNFASSISSKYLGCRALYLSIILA
jgi:hypothetical protein